MQQQIYIPDTITAHPQDLYEDFDDCWNVIWVQKRTVMYVAFPSSTFYVLAHPLHPWQTAHIAVYQYGSPCKCRECLFLYSRSVIYPYHRIEIFQHPIRANGASGHFVFDSGDLHSRSSRDQPHSSLPIA
jgi:hypothetical protein